MSYYNNLTIFIGNPELWPGAVEVLVTNATNLMTAIAELLEATEIAAVTKSEMKLHSLEVNSISCLQGILTFL